ncbi:MAG: M28 family peptidase [Chthoniobacterales bacterium]
MPEKKSLLVRIALLLGGALLLALVIVFVQGHEPVAVGEPWKDFSGAKALAQVQALVDFGPRPAGSEALGKSRAYITQELERVDWKVREQSFKDETPRGPVNFVNLIATYGGERSDRKPRFLLCSHYDTKIFDSFTFVGANDGGSSTGALLEMARVLSLHPALAARVDLVFFDGEEAVEEFSATDGLYGSRHFARQLEESKNKHAYQSGVVWDMMGDRDLTITLPLDSPPALATGIFAAADALRVRNYFTYYTDDVLDDHSPLNAIGIPTIDLIDFDYPPWHTAGDTMDKLSAESLQIVGAVTAYYLARAATP